LSEPKPELKQFGELSPADFQRHPVWIACHTEDFAEPWFNETEQPHLFVSGKSFGFWGGMAGVRPDRRTALYEALGKGPEALFPIRFSTDADLATGVAAGQIDGFYRGTRVIDVEF